MVTWKDDVMEKESCKSYDVSEAAGDISSSAKLWGDSDPVASDKILVTLW